MFSISALFLVSFSLKPRTIQPVFSWLYPCSSYLQQLESNFSMTTLKNILSLSTIALLVSACGAKSQPAYFYNPQTQLNAGTFAGTLPQLPAAAQTIDVAPANSAQPQTSTVPAFQSNLVQASQDFGYLNDCYRSILAQANGYFQSSYGADAIFQGAGQRLVQCYNDTIKQRTDQQKQVQQAYQNYIYQQNYINQMYAAYLAMNRQNTNGSQFTIARPPGVQ